MASGCFGHRAGTPSSTGATGWSTLGSGPGDRGGMVACAGSLWISVHAGLLRVGLWALEVGPLVEAPEGPVAFLACGGGLLAGGSGLAGLFVIDFLRDDGLRHLDVDLGGPLRALVTTREAVWALPEDRREIRLVRLP